MNRLPSRRSRLIAAQAALVVLLSVLLYVGLLQPSTPSRLVGGTVPGSPHTRPPERHPHQQHHHGGGPPANRNPSGPTPGGGPSGQPGGGNAIGTPPTQPSSGPPSGPQGPGGDQYQNAVVALKAKLGLAAAGVP